MRLGSLRGAARPAEAALYLMAFLMQLGMGIMAPVLPEVKETFAVSAAEVSLTISAFGFARLLVDLPAGLFVDRVRPTVLFLTATALIALGGLAGWQATSFTVIIAARAVMGAGSAISMITSQYILSRLAGPQNRGRLLGTYQAALLAGGSLSPAIGGAVAVLAGWRSSFLFCALTALLAFASVVATRQGTARPGTSEGGGRAPRARPEAARLRSRAFFNVLIADLITFVLFFHAGGFQGTVVPLIGGVRLGLDAGTIGLAIGVGTVVRFAASIGGGDLSDRFGRRSVLVPGLLLMGVGVLGFNYVDSFALYVGVIVVMALGRFGNSIPTALIVDQLPAHLWGRAMGINRFVGDLGAALGPLALGWIVDHYDYGTTTLVVTTLVWSMAVLAFVAVREPRRRPLGSASQQ